MIANSNLCRLIHLTYEPPQVHLGVLLFLEQPGCNLAGQFLAARQYFRR